MTLPRQFRRLRIALIGYGDIAKRIAQKTSGHGPRWLAIGRSAKLPDAKIMDGKLGASFHNPAGRPRYLAWDLDHPKVAQRIARVSQAMIVLSPPADQHPRNAFVNRAGAMQSFISARPASTGISKAESSRKQAQRAQDSNVLCGGSMRS